MHKFPVYLSIAYLWLLGSKVTAQNAIVPDQSLGAEASIVQPRPGFDAITGGASRGSGLFHSFGQLSVGDRLNAQFLVAPNIQTIFARVTGNETSNILGTLGTKLDDGITPSTASLFLLNPKGILFGPNATLDLAGSFLATTASSITFANQEFSAIAPQIVSLLTISVPTGLQFGPQVGEIILDRTTAIFPQSLSLIGGNTRLSQAVLITQSGQLEIAAIGAKEAIGLNLSQNNWTADYQTVKSFSDITINGNNTIAIDRPNGTAGNIHLRGHNILLDNSTESLSVISNNSSNGNIILNASDRILLQNLELSTLNPSTGGNIAIVSPVIQQQGKTYITTNLSGPGKAGDISIDASKSFSLIGGSDRRSSTIASTVNNGDGTTGNITIASPSILIQDGASVGVESNGGSTGMVSLQSLGPILLSGISPDGNQTQIFNSQNGATTTGPGIRINAKSLTIDNGARISTIGSADGSSKAIEITVAEDVVVQGGNSAILPFRGENLSVGLPSKISTAKLNGSGNSGDISIRAQTVKVLAGADIESEIGRGDNDFQGKAGDITIDAANLVLVSGQSAQKILETLDYYNPSNISSSVALDGNAQAGAITINSDNIEVKAGGVISSDTRGQGNAGNINLNARDRLLLTGEGSSGPSAISSATYIAGQGDSGQIQVRAKALTITEGGAISTSTAGSGKAGQVFVNIAGLIAIQGQAINGNPSSISSNSRSYGPGDRATLSDTLQILGGTSAPSEEATGAGGDVIIIGDRLNLTDGAEIAALSTGQGTAGNIVLQFKDRVILNNGNIKTTADKTSGGNIDLTARAIALRNNSNIKTSIASGSGQGGNINLTADGIVLLGDSNLLAFARDGKGGNISLFTSALLTRTYKPANLTTNLETLETNGLVDINATGRTSGIVRLPELNPLQNNRPEITPSLIDTAKILSRSCLVRNPETGTFYITGPGGLPLGPADLKLSDYSTLPAGSEITLAEADSLYSLPNGQIALAQRCQAP